MPNLNLLAQPAKTDSSWRILLALSLALLLLLATGVVIDTGFSESVESARWVEHTRDVIETLNALLASLRDAETGQRGFLLTGDDAYAQPYREATPNVSKHLETLRTLTLDNPLQQEHIQELRPVTQAKLDELAQTIRLRREQGMEPALQVVMTGQGQRLMERIRILAGQMENEERRLLIGRKARVASNANRMKGIMIAVMVLASGILALLTFSLHRERQDRLQTRQALADSEERRQLALDAASLGTWSWFLATDDLLWSDRCKQLLGLPVSAPVHYEQFIQAVHTGDRDAVGAAIRRSLDAGDPFDVEFRTVWPSGETRWLRAKGLAHSDEQGHSLRFNGIMMDIDEQRRAADALRRSERRYSALFANRLNAIAHCRIILDEHGKPFDYEILQVNHAYEQITGMKRDEIEGRTARAAFPGIENADFDYIGTYGRIALEGGEISFEVFFDPLRQWLSIYVYNPAPHEFTAIFTDITSQKQAEAALRASEERFRQLAETIQEVFWVFDPKSSQILYVSPAYEQIWGRKAEALYANPREWSSAIREEQRSRVEKAFAATVATGSFDETYEVVRPDGSCCWVWDRGWSLHNEAGEAFRLVGVAEDVTRRREAEAEIQRLNADLERRVAERTAALEAANQELEAFSYSVSHDLRAPLRGIDGFARILVEEYAPQLGAKPQRYLQLVRNEARRMGELVDDLLDFSRLNRQNVNRQSVDVEALVRQVWDQLQPERKDRQIEFHLGSLGCCSAEPAMLRQVWVNLLTNAVKFTRKKAFARIEVDCLPPTNDFTTAVYYVRDNGVGFDMRYADNMFGVFQRLHRAEDYEGTGVGLAIVQRILRRHGGDVGAVARPNQGATLFFTLDGPLPENAVELFGPNA